MGFHNRFICFYRLVDWLIAIAVWTLFFYYRKVLIHPEMKPLDAISDDPKYWYGIAVIPICWLIIFQVFGSYRPLYQQSYSVIMVRSFWAIVVGSLGLLFFVFYDDLTLGQVSFVKTFAIFFWLSFLAHFLVRALLYTLYNARVNSGKSPLSTIWIGNEDTEQNSISARFQIASSVSFDKLLENHKLLESAHEIVINSLDYDGVKKLLSLSPFISSETNIRAIEITDQARLAHLSYAYELDTDTIKVKLDTMYVWQKNLKRLIDVITSIVVLVLFVPILALIALMVGLTSKGPVIYSQERLGKKMTPFKIYKFRTMVDGAEQGGPQLSSEDDSRITSIGRILRKTHLDELPQFYNVLKGDMSIVGPRPERPYYVNQILEINPQLRRLYSVHPGITSWGQVKYGYASSLDEIIRRTKFDLLYLDNRSLFLDFRIIILTIKVILSGSK